MGPRMIGVLAQLQADDIRAEDYIDWRNAETLLVLSLVLVAILVLVAAGSWGFVGFLRTLDREGRRVASGDWPDRPTRNP